MEKAKVDFTSGNCVDEKPSLRDMLANLAASIVFLLVGVVGVFLVLLRHPLHPLKIAALLHPYALPEEIFTRVLSGYISSIPGWVFWIKYLSYMSEYISGRVRDILDAFIAICFFAPVLVALFSWPLGLHPLSFNFKAFGWGAFFTFCYFTFAAMFLR